ncbi:MAG: hypothetical protein HY719_15040 [Planctomycetes bacterium]|nr:hypothetical protein [Planctomycetota bacterium]
MFASHPTINEELANEETTVFSSTQASWKKGLTRDSGKALDEVVFSFALPPGAFTQGRTFSFGCEADLERLANAALARPEAPVLGVSTANAYDDAVARFFANATPDELAEMEAISDAYHTDPIDES